MRLPGTSAGENPWAQTGPTFASALISINYQKTALQAGGPWGHSHHVSSVTER